jgi:AraC-like DNA-binding protein
MIALVNVLPPGPNAGIETLDCLPLPGAAAHAGWLVGCSDCGEIQVTLSWYDAVRAVRPTVALGLVCPLDQCAPLVGALPYPVRPLLGFDSLLGGRVPEVALGELRAMSVAGRLIEELALDYGDAVLAERALLEALVARAIRGGTLEGLSRALGCHPETLRRALVRFGLRPGQLMSRIRLRAYELMDEGGDAPARALAACGWTNPNARHKARSRLVATTSASPPRPRPDTDGSAPTWFSKRS